MIIKNEKNYPMFLRYAGKARAGRDLRAGECSPPCPLDRLQLKVMQDHIKSGIISVFVTETEKLALTGNISDNILNALKVEAPNNIVTVKETAPVPVKEPVAKVSAETLEEDPIKKYAKKAKPEVAPEAPSAEVPVEEGTVENTVEPVTEAEVTLPVATVEAATDVPEAAEDPIQEQVASYEFMNKQQLMTEIEKRGLRKPALSTSTAKLRELLQRDDADKP